MVVMPRCSHCPSCQQPPRMLKAGYMQAVRMLISPLPLDSQLSGMRDHVIGYILACGIAHRLNELFSLFDKPQVILNSRFQPLMPVIC